MKRIVFLSVLLLSLAATSVFGANKQELIPADSYVYASVKALYSEVGFAPPSLSVPWSVGELEDILSYIPQEKLSKQGKSLLSEIQDRFAPREMIEKTFDGRIGFEPTLETYVHKDDAHYQLETDWIYNYDSRKPLIGIPIEIFLTDYIYSKTDFAILQTRNSKNDVTNITDSSEIFSPTFSFNNPFSEAFVNHVDLNFPERAVIGLGSGRLNLVIGRDDLNWGSGRTGSLTIGDHLDYYDFIRFSTFHKNFKYTYLLAGFDSPSWLSTSQNSTPDEDDDTTVVDDNLKMYVAHRFEFRMFSNRMTFALTEAMMYQTSTLDLRYLNPALFYHNLFIRGNSNSTLALEVNVNPYKNLHLYGNIIIDEVPYPGEDQTSSGAHPSGVGQQYGIEGEYPLGKGYLSAFAEFVHTDPYLYLRDQVDYIVNRRIFNMESGFSVKKNFLGYEYGNDTIVIATGVDYWISSILSSSISATYMLHGETNMDTIWTMGPDSVNRITPYDDPSTADKTIEKTLKISTNFEIFPFYTSTSKHLQNLSVMNQLDFINHTNKDNTTGLNTFDIQWIFGINWKL